MILPDDKTGLDDRNDFGGSCSVVGFGHSIVLSSDPELHVSFFPFSIQFALCSTGVSLMNPVKLI